MNAVDCRTSTPTILSPAFGHNDIYIWFISHRHYAHIERNSYNSNDFLVSLYKLDSNVGENAQSIVWSILILFVKRLNNYW